MRIAGIVVEYNPFHNGHLHQIQEIKRQLDPDAIVVVMSGQFTQRGTPCITDKHTRARMALANGIDMVLELPLPLATASAEYFADAAVSTFHKAGIITHLSFGCETPNLPLLKRLASTLLDEPTEVSQSIKEMLSQGISYPRARQLALTTYLSSHTSIEDFKALDSLLSNPNNILGIEYMKALIKYDSQIEPFPIQRTGSGYHDETISHTIASATAIRKHLGSESYDLMQHAMPPTSASLLLSTYKPLITLDDFSDLLHYKLIFSNLDYLYALWDIPKNLCQSIVNASKEHLLISEIINSATSKTYSRATVSRAILRILLDIREDFMLELKKIDYIPHIRVLACKHERKALLSHLCKQSAIPIITQFSKGYKEASPLSRTLLDLEIAASKLYGLKKQNHNLSSCDFSSSIFSKNNIS